MRMKITLLKLETPSCIWAMESPSVSMSEDARAFHNLQHEMKEYFDDENSMQFRVSDVKPGKMCIGRRQSDKMWYRLKVMSTMQTRSGPHARCSRVDYAQTDLYSYQWLREAPDRFMKVPPQAKQFVLAGLQPVTLKTSMEDFNTTKQPTTIWDTSAVEFINQLLQDSTSLEVEVLHTDESGRLHVKMFLNRHEEAEPMCVNDELVRRDYAMAVEGIQDVPLPTSDSESTSQHSDNVDIFGGRSVNGESTRVQHSRPNRPAINPSYSSILSDSEVTDSGGLTLKQMLASGQSKQGIPSQVESAVSTTLSSSGISQFKNNALSLSNMQSTLPRATSPKKEIVSPSGSTSSVVSPVGRGSPTVQQVAPGSISPQRLSLSLNSAGPAVGIGRGRGRLLDSLLNTDKTEVQTSPNVAPNSSPTGNIQKSSPSPLQAALMGKGRGLMLMNTLNDTPLRQPVAEVTRVTNNPMASNSGYSSADGASSGSESSTRKPRSRLPKKALQQQEERKRRSTSSGRVHFSENEEILTKKTSPGNSQPSKSILKRTSDSETDSKKPTNSILDSHGTPKTALNQSLNDIFTPRTDLTQHMMTSPLLQQSPAERCSSVEEVHSQVLIRGEIVPKMISKLQDAPFVELIKMALIKLEYVGPNLLEAFSWPSILRGRDVVGVSAEKPRGAYLLPFLSQILQKNTYESLPPGNGPLGLIIASSWIKVRDIHDNCELIIHGLKTMRVLTLFGGGSEESQIVPLINGCEVLIATPHCLLRMLDKGHTNLHRLCHLVLDDADILSEEFTEQIKQIMKKFLVMLRERSARSLPRQTLVFSKTWTQGIRSFMNTYMRDPILVITSKVEAAVYGQVKQVEYTCHMSQRQTRLLGLLETLASSSLKIVIFTSSENEAFNIYQLLRSYSYYTIIAHDDMPLHEIENTQQTWDSKHAEGSKPILVMTDTVMCDVKIKNANAVIHYDLPQKKSAFGKRLYYMMDNFPGVNGEVSGQTSSHIFVTEENMEQAHYIVKLLQRLGQPVSRHLLSMTAGLLEGREEGKQNNLCPFIKAFGFCRDNLRCNYRHVISKLLDDPQTQKQYIKLPVSGDVKIRISHVIDASFYYAQLLEHREDGATVPLNHSHAELAMDLALHYANSNNRKHITMLQVEQLYAYEGKEKTFNRVRIIDLAKPNRNHIIEEAKVHYIDDGHTEIVKTNELFELPNKFAEIPPQAIEVFICRVRPADEDVAWTDKASCFVADLVSGHQMDGRIVLSLANALWLNPLVERSRLIHLKINISRFKLRSALLRNGLAVDNTEHLNLLYAACEKGGINVPDKCKNIDSTENVGAVTEPDFSVLPESQDYHDVYISAVDTPLHFFVQKVQDYNKLEDMMESIEKYMENPPKQAPLQVTEGMLCLSKFPVDGKWYRCRVMSVTPNEKNEYDVFYVDHGDSDYVTLEDMCALPPQFSQLPLQAVEVGLANIVSIEDVWTEESQEALWSLSQDDTGLMRTLVAKVISKSSATMAGQHKYELQLYDTISGCDLDLAQELIIKGHAIGSAKSAQILFPEAFEEGRQMEPSYMQIPKLCVDLFLEQNTLARCELGKKIMGIIVKNSQNSQRIRESGGLKSVCALLKYLGSQDTLKTILFSLNILISHDKGNIEVVGEHGIVVTLLKLLSSTNYKLDLLGAILWGLKMLLTCHRNQEIFLAHDGLAAVIKSVDYVLEPKDQENTCLIIELLLQGNPGCWVVIRDSRFLKSLASMLTLSSNVPLLTAATAVMSLLTPQPGMKEMMKRDGCIKALCSRIGHVKDEKFLTNALQALKKVSANNRDAKETIISSGAMNELNSLLEGKTKMPAAVKFLCNDLITRLKKFSPTVSPAHGVSRSPNKPIKLSSPAINASLKKRPPATSDSDQEVQNQRNKPIKGIRPLKIAQDQVINAQPIPDDLPPLEGVLERVHPMVQWAQNRYIVLLSVKVFGVSEDGMEASFTEKSVKFCATVESTEYYFDFDLYEMLAVAQCQVQVSPMEVLISLRKMSRGRWPRLLKEKQKPAFLSLDHARFVDSSSDSDSGHESESHAFVLKKVKNPLRYTTFGTLDWDQECKESKYKDGVPEGEVQYSDSNESNDSNDFKGDYASDDENDGYFKL